jgi:thermitase
MTWVHWRQASRTLQARLVTPGSPAVLGVAGLGDLQRLRARYRFGLIRVFPDLHAAEVRASVALVAATRLDSRIRYLSPLGSPQRLLSLATSPLVTDLDPLTGVSYEWQFEAANVGAALALSAGSASIVVGTIDSGVADIPDLTGKVDERWTVSSTGRVTRGRTPVDFVGHGTAVASLIAGNGFGMAGFGGAAHVVAIRAPSLTPIAVAVALMKLDTLGVRIVNLSFGSAAPEPPIVLDAIHKAAADGLLLVAAAGNAGAAVAHPAADLQSQGGHESDGLSVGASDADGNLAFFSNAGDRLSLVAPGSYRGPCSGVLVAAPLSVEFVNACYPSWTGVGGASYAYVSGTSFAAPEVAGVAALVWAVRPTLTNVQVANIVKQSARRVGGDWTPATGCGALDAAAAVELALSRSSAEWADVPPVATTCSAR